MEILVSKLMTVWTVVTIARVRSVQIACKSEIKV